MLQRETPGSGALVHHETDETTSLGDMGHAKNIFSLQLKQKNEETS